jgi:hypothetical protein
MADAVLHDGRVRRQDGAAAPGPIVAVTRGTAPTPEIGIRCDVEGRFRIALPPGRYEIEARAPDGELGTVSIETSREAQIVEIVLSATR